MPSGRRARGRLRVPSSKSLTHRYFNLALLSGAPVVIERPLYAEDTRLFHTALGRCGFAVEESEDEVRLTPAARPAATGEGADEVEIHCGNAGTMLRFLVATLTVVPGRWRLDGVPRLREQPVGPLVDALRRLGAKIRCLAPRATSRARIEGGAWSAASPPSTRRRVEPVPLRPSDGGVAGAVRGGGGGADAHLSPLRRRDDGRRRRLRRPHRAERGRAPTASGRRRCAAGARPRRGDYSAACYPAAAAALTGGEVILDGLSPDSKQGDREFMDLLAAMGAEVFWKGAISASAAAPGELRGIKADLSNMPDQVPTLAALAPFAAGAAVTTSPTCDQGERPPGGDGDQAQGARRRRPGRARQPLAPRRLGRRRAPGRHGPRRSPRRPPHRHEHRPWWVCGAPAW